MVHDQLFDGFLLGGLLWLGVYVYVRWQRGRATKDPSVQQTKSVPQAHKLFPGLTHKPHCQACEQDQEHVASPPPAPPPRVVPKRGRPRTVATHLQYCPTKTCPYYGWVGQGNIRANGHPGGGAWRQFHCVACDTCFLETYGTLLHRKTRSVEVIVRVVAAVAEGLGIRAVARSLRS
jgi:hypothetical protein